MRKQAIQLPSGRNHLPCVTGRQLDNACEQVIRRFDPDIIARPHPLDIEAFAEQYLQLTIDYVHLSSDHSTLGMMIYEDSDLIPYYNKKCCRADLMHADADTVLIESDLLSRDNLCRFRFTLAHECGHALWHAPYFAKSDEKTRSYACRMTDIFGKPIRDERVLSEIARIEWQANKSASSLLMPRTSVYRLLDSAQLSCANVKEQLEMIQLVCGVFNVSKEAATYRLRDLGYRLKPVTASALGLVYGSKFLFPQIPKDGV